MEAAKLHSSGEEAVADSPQQSRPILKLPEDTAADGIQQPQPVLQLADFTSGGSIPITNDWEQDLLPATARPSESDPSLNTASTATSLSTSASTSATSLDAADTGDETEDYATDAGQEQEDSDVDPEEEPATGDEEAASDGDQNQGLDITLTGDGQDPDLSLAIRFPSTTTRVESPIGPLTSAVASLYTQSMALEKRHAQDERLAAEQKAESTLRERSLAAQLTNEKRAHGDTATQLIELAKELGDLQAEKGDLQTTLRELKGDLEAAKQAHKDTLHQQLETTQADRSRLIDQMNVIMAQANQPLPLSPCMAAEREALVDAMESAVISRVAEALHRSHTEAMSLTGAVREEVYRRTVTGVSGTKKTCPCAAEASEALARAPSRPPSSMDAHVERVVRAIVRRQPVTIADVPYGEYSFSTKDDRAAVQRAQQNGRGNMTAYTILTNGDCLDPRSTATAILTESCPTLMAAATATVTPTAEEVAATAAAAEAATAAANLEATQQPDANP